MGERLPDGYYAENGWWTRLKYCFYPCVRCTCQPPNGVFYSKAHDKRLQPSPAPTDRENENG